MIYTKEIVAKKSFCGYPTAVLLLIISTLKAFKSIKLFLQSEFASNSAFIEGCSFAAYPIFAIIFFLIILINKNYLEGKPEFWKMWPLLASSCCISIPMIFSYIDLEDGIAVSLVIICIHSIVLAILYAMYFGDDADSESSWICFKPFSFEETTTSINPVYAYPQNVVINQGTTLQGYATSPRVTSNQPIISSKVYPDPNNSTQYHQQASKFV